MDAFNDAGVLEAISNAFAIGFVFDSFANHRQVILRVCVLDMGKQLGSFSYQGGVGDVPRIYDLESANRPVLCRYGSKSL